MSNEKIKKLYNETFKRYGSSPMAVQWGNAETQVFRFRILCEMTNFYPGDDLIILDYGCGLGDLFDYLRRQGFKGKYIGADINENLINFAEKKYMEFPQAKFMILNSEKDLKNLGYDYCLISGVFNNKIGRDQKILESIIKKVFKNCKRGVAFNALSNYAAKKDKNLAYFSPTDIIKFCMDKITRLAVLRHDWRGGNFAVYLYRNR